MYQSILLSVILASTSALAQTTSTTSVTAPTTATNAPAGQSISAPNRGIGENIRVNVFSNFKGPNVSDLGTAETVNQNGETNKRARMNFDTDVAMSYMLTKDYGVGISVPFLLMATKGTEFVIGDVGLRLTDRKLISNKDFNLALNITAQASTSTASRERGQEMGLKVSPALRYNIPDSRFTLGAWTEGKAYFGPSAGKLFKLYAQPYASYQLAPKWSAVLGFEYEAHHMANTGALDFITYQHDIIPSVSYMVSPGFFINPYLAFYTTKKLSWDHTALGAIITASI